MQADQSVLPLLAVLLPVATAVFVVGLRRRPDVREGATILGSVATFGVVAAMLPGLLDGRPHAFTLGPIVPGVEPTLRADALGMVFGLSASLLWVLASFYAIGYMRGEGAKKQTRFYASFALCLGSTFALAFAADLLTFFVAYELLTIATYPLVAHKENDEARAAGRKYLAYLLSGGAALLAAVTIVYATTGEMGFVAGGFVAEAVGTGTLVALFALMIVGFGTKAGIMPLHSWLPAAMVAPTPVSALLHAVAVVKAGVFGFARAIGYVLGPEPLADINATLVLATLAAITILVASAIALRQDNLKRRLAFSTIAHLSYIVLGLSLLSQIAWDGALLHIVNHAALKITLFFAAGAIHIHLHLDRVSELDGLARRMPFTMVAFAVASVGLAGLPPMGGFVSKLFLAQGAFDAGAAVFGLVMIGSGLFTAGYLFPIVYRAFFRPVPVEGAEALTEAQAHAAHAHAHAPATRDASPLMVAPLVITAAAALALGLGDVFGMGGIADTVATAVMGASP